MNETINDHTLAFNITNETPKIRFLASLSDGRTVIQDDRPKQQHAWIRLSKWIKSNPQISITGIRLQGPTNINFTMPSNQKGYFWGQKQHAVWQGPQYNYTGIGYYDGQKVNICWYKQPRFDHAFTEERTAKRAGFFLIENLNDTKKLS